MVEWTDTLWLPKLMSWVTILERRKLFGRDIAMIAPVGSTAIVSVPFDSLFASRPFDLPAAMSTVAGARLWNALGSDLFLAPLVSRVLPLPHQFRVLRQALGKFPVRLMLADEVGMGKTIESGLIIKEMKLRGLVERILILAPKSLLLQWIVEMDTLFGETFDLVLPGMFGAAGELRAENAWKRYTQVVTSVDSVKPREEQRGWSAARIAKYNLARMHDLIGAGFDLVVIDEAHQVAGASEDVSRYELAKELAKTIPHVLLLTATPHSGKSDAFRRLLTLLEPNGFPTDAALTREAVSRVVVRSDKRSATDADGKPLFAPRTTTLVQVPFAAHHALQERLYEEVSRYVIESYNKAERMGQKGSRLLLILIQRLASSSTRAIRLFLEKRAAILRAGEATERSLASDTELDDTDANEVAENALFVVPADTGELKDVERLLEWAVRVEAAGPDARAEALYEHMQRLARAESDPSLKFLIFDEFSTTQEMLREFLEQRGYAVAMLNGTMDIAERRAALEAFRGPVQVLLSTEAGGAGLNVQFAHIVFNYSLPFNPMRVEQRIGRVDRIGQTHPVQAFNFVLENSIEARVYQIWQAKLSTILAEFGVDKTGDVLDSAVAGGEFEKLARTALFRPEALEHEFDRVVTEIKQAAQKARETSHLFTTPTQPMDQPPRVPLYAWLETIQAASDNAATVEPRQDILSQIMAEIAMLRPSFAAGKPVPCLRVSGMGFPLDGWFSIWKVGIAGGQWRQQRTFALFVDLSDTAFAKSAQRLWDELAARRVDVEVIGETDDYDLAAQERLAESEASELYITLVTKTQEQARRRRGSVEMSYLARRTALANIVSEEMRTTRRAELEAEYQGRKADVALALEALPDLVCLFLARVTAS
jgi:superfamily II DNA or RNA helicase